MEEQRKHQRWPAYLGGRACFSRNQSTADVLIRNTSESGAKVVVHNGVFVPNRFTLQVPRRNKEYRAIARWRRGDEIGVELT